MICIGEIGGGVGNIRLVRELMLRFWFARMSFNMGVGGGLEEINSGYRKIV